MLASNTLQDYVAERVAGLDIASYAIAAVAAGERYAVADGVLRQDASERVTTATPFHICSCSKAFTALAFARLVDAGQADWDAPVAPVVPEFGLADPWITKRYTFRDLAGMRLGLSRDGIAEWGFRQDAPVADRLGRARAMPFDAAFRDRFSYSNLNYIALACAISRLGGASFAHCLKQLVFDPAGLRDASLETSARAAAPHMPDGKAMVAVPELTGPNSQGSARVHLSARDAAAWLAFNLSLIRSDTDSDARSAIRGETHSDSPGAAMELFRPQSLVRPLAGTAGGIPSPWAYGCGWLLSAHDGALLHHGGGGRGWRTMAILDPVRQRGVMVMLAHEGAAAEALAWELLDLLAGRAPVHRLAVLAARSAQDAAARNAAADLRRRPAAAWREPLPGCYANAVTGKVRLSLADRGHLHFAAEDAPAFDATLAPTGEGVFEFRFEHPALRTMPLDPPFQLRFGLDPAGRSIAQTTYFGDLEQIERKTS